MKYSIEDLRNGKVAVINDGTVEELRRVLKESFPNDDSRIDGISDYYYKSKNYNYWSCDASTRLPKQSVKDFLNQEPKEEEFKWGEEVIYYNKTHYTWETAIYVNKNPSNTDFHILTKDGYTFQTSQILKSLTKIELTKQQIAEKFNIPVEQLVIKD